MAGSSLTHTTLLYSMDFTRHRLLHYASKTGSVIILDFINQSTTRHENQSYSRHTNVNPLITSLSTSN